MEGEDPGLEAWRYLLVAHARALRAVEADVEVHGRVPLTWYDVLLELNAARGRLRMNELATRVVLSRTRLSRLVDEMAATGIVRKETDDVDRRVTWAVLHPAGKEALRKTAPAYHAAIQRHFAGHLDEAEQVAAARALKKVADAHRSGACVDCPPSGRADSR